MFSWCFVGRADELSLLAAAAAGTTGRGVAVSGPAGVGKSWLLREGLARLGAERFAIWTVCATPATGGLPFGSFAHLLPADQPGGLSPSGLLRWAFDALAHQAAGRRVVFAIDDIHLVDPLSAALINLVARSDQATVLATLRTGEPVHDSVSALWTSDVVERVELAPLSLAETAQLLPQVLDGTVDATSTRHLHRLSQGNALLLRELVLAARSGGDLTEAYGTWRWSGRLDLAPSLVEVIDARIGQLGDDIRTVLELVAFGEPMGLRLLCAATGTTAVQTAEERALIRVDRDDRRSPVRLVHPLYGEVVGKHCPMARRQRLLARLADLVEAMGARRRDDPLRVAVWRLESRTAHDPAQLLAAGAQAFAAFNMPLAIRLAGAARAAGGGFDAAVLLATILMLADRPADALATVNEVGPELTSGEQMAQSQTAQGQMTQGQAAQWHSTRGLVRYWGLAQVEAADDLAAAASTLDDPGDRAWVMAFESHMRLHHLECDAALRLARAVLDRPAASASARAIARSAIAHLQALRGRTAQATRTVAAIEADSARWRTQTPHIQLALELARGTSLILAGHLASAEARAAAEFADLSDAGDFRLGSGYLSTVLGQSARLRGRLVESTRHLRKACATLATSRVFTGLAHAERAHTAALRGDAAEATRAMAEADRRADPTMAIFYPWLEQARCWVWVSTGDVETAVTMAHELAGRLRADRFHGCEAAVLHDLVRLGRAEEVLDRLTVLVGKADGLTELMAAHARAAAGRDPSGLLAVANRFAGVGLHLFAAEAAANAFNRLRQTRSGRVVQAARTFADLLDSCEDPRTPGLIINRTRLSPREHQIATLAAAGETSRDIAEKLYLSVRTIDNHLRRVYAKLDVSGRGGLAAALRTSLEGR